MSLTPCRPDRFGAARSRTGALMHALSRQESRAMASNVTCWKSPKSEYAALAPGSSRISLNTPAVCWAPACLDCTDVAISNR